MRVAAEIVHTLFHTERQVELPLDPFVNGLIVLSVGIGKRDDRRIQQDSKVILATHDLVRAFGYRQFRQISVRAAVRTKLNSLPGPVSNLFRGHQLKRTATLGFVPRIRSTDSLGDNEYGGAKSVSAKNG